MPWDPVNLNDGKIMPSIVFGTWKTGKGQESIDQVDQAISVGFSHIDTAQNYRNEVEAGIAIRESGLARDDIFITTKYSGLNGLDVPTSIRDSLKNLGVAYVDLYLIHGPSIALPDITTTWNHMEDVQKQGLAKSIGVSNFNVDELKTILASSNVTPVLNQILFHPYVYDEQAPILSFSEKHDIVIEAYSPLIPLTKEPGGPLDAPLASIARRLNASTDQILLAWAKAKGTVPVTASSKKYRLEGYLKAGNLVLTSADISAIDKAGSYKAKVRAA